MVDNNLRSECAVAALARFRPVLLALAREGLGRDLQAKIGASDIVQQTMLEVYQSVSPRVVCDQTFIAWISTVLMNNLRDAAKAFRRTRKRKTELELRLNGDYLSTKSLRQMVDVLAQVEQIERLKEILAQLPSAHQQMIQWRFFDDMSYPQIAEMLGRSENAVRMMIRRSLFRLAREMKCNGYSTAC